MLMRAALLCVTLAALSACGARDPLPPGVDALVTPRQISVAFPVDESRLASPYDSLDRSVDYYDWTFGVPGPTGFVAILALGHDAPPTPDQLKSPKTRLRAATLRICDPMTGHTIECGRRPDAAGRVIGGRVVVVVRDTTLVKALLRERPAYLWRSVKRPGRWVVRDTIRVTYGM